MDMQVKGITQFIGRKLIRLTLLLIAVSIFSFVLISLSPIDPINAYIGADMTRIGAEQRDLIAQR
jgi:peptide/nickel transport system permease protein